MLVFQLYNYNKPMKMILILFFLINLSFSACTMNPTTTVCSNYSTNISNTYNSGTYCLCTGCPLGKSFDSLNLSCCSSSVSNCLTCLGSATAMCTKCINNSYAINPSGSCDLCNTILNNCITCTNNTVCTQCVSSFFIVPNNYTNCVQCLNVFPNCLTCTIANCTSCKNNYGFNLTSGKCQLCSSNISYCQICKNLTTCIACSNQAILQTTGLCKSCGFFMPYCLICSSNTSCLQCNIYAFFQANGTCSQCSTFLSNCYTCTNSSYCISCNREFAFDSSHICTTCSFFMPNCEFCYSSTQYCTICISDQFAVLTTPTPDQCQFCNVSMQFCMKCISVNFCYQCTNDTFLYLKISGNLNSSSISGGYYAVRSFTGTYGICTICNATYPYCIACNNIKCLTCIVDNTITYINNNTCALCISQINYCKKCTINTNCTQCISNFYALVHVNNTHQHCQLCSNLMANCLFCINSQICTSCIVGGPIKGGCTQVAGCSKVVQTGLSQSVCSACYTYQFYPNPNPSNGLCECLKGHVAGIHCTQIVGCLMVRKMSSGDECLNCDTSAHFKLQNNICPCDKYFEWNGYKCIDICGDGHLFQLQCDDGNTDNYDGCSSTCQVQRHYSCSKGNAVQASICTLISHITVDLNQIAKVPGMNQMLIKFTIQPPTNAIFKLNMNNTLNFSTDANCQIDHVIVDQMSIQLYVNFYQSLSDNFADLLVTFDRTVINSPNYHFKFPLKPTNGQSFDYDPYTSNNQDNMLALIIKMLGMAAICVFIFASLAQKMIGVQTIHTFQYVLIAQIFSKKYYIHFTDFQQMLSVYGQNNVLFQEQPIFSNPNLSYLLYSTNILSNYVIIGVTIAALSFIYVIIRILIQKIMQREQNQQKQIKLSFKAQIYIAKLSLISQIILNYMIFPTVLGFYFHLIITILNSETASESKHIQIDHLSATLIYNSVLVTSILFASNFMNLFAGYIKLQQNKNIQYKNVTNTQITTSIYECSKKYIGIYVLITMLEGVLVQLALMKYLKAYIYISCILTIVKLILFLAIKSYQKLIHVIGIILNHLVVLVGLILNEMVILSPVEKNVILYILLGGLLAVLVLALIRSIYCFRQRYRQVNNKKGLFATLLNKKKNAQKIERQNMRYFQQENAQNSNHFKQFRDNTNIPLNHVINFQQKQKKTSKLKIKINEEQNQNQDQIVESVRRANKLQSMRKTYLMVMDKLQRKGS